MYRKSILIAAVSVIVMASVTGCGKEDGTKYEYAENIIFEEDETSIKLLNSTESEAELKLNFALENFETEDVKVKVYNPEEEEITENIECSFDAENNSVSIRGDISQIEMAEVDLNYNTNLKLKELKNEEFKYLLTNFEDDHGCTYLGDLDDFKVKEDEESADGNDASSDESADGEKSESAGPARPQRMTKDEIFELLKGKWKSSDGDFTVEFGSGGENGSYRVKAAGRFDYESDVTYFDETKTENGDHKIRYVTGSVGYGSCRELILSADGNDMSYIAGLQKNDNGDFEEIYISCKK